MQNQSIDIYPIQKLLDKNERELPKEGNSNKRNSSKKKLKIRRNNSTTRSKRKIST